MSYSIIDLFIVLVIIIDSVYSTSTQVRGKCDNLCVIMFCIIAYFVSMRSEKTEHVPASVVFCVKIVFVVD